MFHGFCFQEWGEKGLAAVQCAPQQQLLVVEVRWEEEFTTCNGTSKAGMIGNGTEEGSK